MSTLSLPSMLFTIADLVARRGWPEPIGLQVRFHHDSGEMLIDVDLRTEADVQRWAKLLGNRGVSQQEVKGAHGPYTLFSATAHWRGAFVMVDARVPVVSGVLV
ncbi:hypothetical protein JNW90_19905 [Micromonospora sp. STR1s_5]|nr:hypothetical protein [Micromonospora sp. STR1s_5]